MIAFLFSTAPTIPVFAQPVEGVTPVAAAPGDVEVGLWLNGLNDLDLLLGSFNAVFYMWWISEDSDFRPFDSLQVLNGRDWQVRAVSREALPDGRHYVAGFLNTTVTHHWDLRNFPFDRPQLEIVIETPYTAEQLQFLPQNDRSAIGEFAMAPGFRIEGLRLDARTETYNTDFGREDSSGTRYSRLSIQLDLVREGGRAVLAILLGFAAANIIALLSFAIDKSMLSTRTAMTGAAIFAAIGNMYMLNRQINLSLGSQVIDHVAMCTFAVILVTLMSSIVIDAMLRRGHEVLAARFNYVMALLVSVASVAFYVVTFRDAMGA